MKTQKIGIFYFSGTGNTEKVAFKYADAFRNLGRKVAVGKIEQYTQYGFTPDLSQYDTIGIGYPVHCFNPPEIVYEFLKMLPHTEEGMKVFLFKTMADPLGYGGSTAGIHCLLEDKGYSIFHEGCLVMPSNWFRKYPKSISQMEWRIAENRILVFAEEIQNRTERLLPNSLISRVLTALGPLEKLRARVFCHYFNARKEDCAHCGICVECCPTKNISMAMQQPKLGWHCISCMRCIYKCPKRAIHFRFFDFFVLKRGYDIHLELNDPFPTVLSMDYADLIRKLPRRLRTYAAEIPE